jgi:hypothetical protein
MKLFAPTTGVLLLASLTACSHSTTPATTTPDTAAVARQQAQQQAQAAQKAREADREELDQIPPPAKNRYMAIHTRESWSNPFLLIGKNTVTLRIMYPDPGTSSALPSTMMRPAGARKRELDLRLANLPEALAALPENSWPYGRVIAMEEDPAAPRPDRPQVRRNVEATMQVLNDLGIVVYEWPGNGVLR